MSATDAPRKPWGQEDKARLISFWNRLGSVFLISFVMERPMGSVQTEASRIGLKRRESVHSLHRKKWNDEAVAEFWSAVDSSVDAWSKIDILAVSEKTQRPIDVVATKLRERFSDEQTLKNSVYIPKDIEQRIARQRTAAGIDLNRGKSRMRECLCCTRMFLSEGAGNRLCLRCKAA
jgi:hypothetical protein